MTKKYLRDNPKLMSEWNYEKNGDLNPFELTMGSHEDVWWKCSICGHEYPAKIYSRGAGRGCSVCAGRTVKPGYNDLATTHPELAGEWHPTKNGNLKPTDVTKGSHDEVWWICEKGHEYPSAIYSRVAGNGCPYCAGKKVLPGYNDLATTHPELAGEWHPTKNGNLKPTDVSAYSNKKVWWICDKGHVYPAFIYSRANGSGCPYCSNRKVWKGYNDLESLFPEIAEEFHPTKNGNLKPSDVTFGFTKKVWWLCKRCGHEWDISVKNRTCVRKSGCPRCNSQGKTSFPEQAIYYYLKQMSADAENRAQIEKNEIDIYLPALNTGIEYDGEFYHKSEKAQERERRKNENLKHLGIRLIRVKEILNGDFGIRQEGDVIYYSRDSSNSLLNDVIHLLAELLFETPVLDIDVVRDRGTIKKRYLSEKRANSIEIKYPTLAEEWHQTKNGGLKPSMFTAGSGEYIWWKCSVCGHEWKTKISHRTAGSGCPECGKKKNKKHSRS